MATPYDFAERQCQLINSINKLVKPIQTQLNLMKIIPIHEQFCSPLDTNLRNIQKNLNDKFITEIYNFQNTMGLVINTQVCQPILELQAKLNTIRETIANQQIAFNKIPQAFEDYIQHVNNSLKDLSSLDIKDIESNISIPVQTDDNLSISIDDISNYMENEIENDIDTICVNEQIIEVIKDIKNDVTSMREVIANKSSVNIISILGLLISFLGLIVNIYTCKIDKTSEFQNKQIEIQNEQLKEEKHQTEILNSLKSHIEQEYKIK